MHHLLQISVYTQEGSRWISTATLPQFAIALCQTLDGVEVFWGVFKYIAEIHCM